VRAFDRVAQYLVGDDQLPRAMALIEPRDLLERALVGAQERRTLLTRLRRAAVAREPITVEITGAPGTGKRFVCEGLAARVGLPLITCDLRLVDAGELDDALHAARREARLANACLCLLHWDAQLGVASRDAPSAAPDPDGPAAEKAHAMPLPLARFFEENELIVMLTAEEREPLLERHAHAIAHLQVPFPLPSQRAALLDEALGALGLVIERGVDLQGVVRRIALAPAALEVAARVAADLANDRDPYTRVVKHAELVEACQRQLHHDLKSLATRVTTTHRWEDLVIPVDVYESLREMIAYAAEANRVYEEWGFGARHGLSRGISALFAGPPGTGKTMCASVIARELDMELFRVDLSRIVSKWIGETEKNLAKVFDEAQRSNAVILFDEADSLFAKRTEVKSSVDRYANLEVNYLLQRMEGFSGVTVLTTNFEDTIDTAFKRRLTFRMRFEKPDAEARTALWRKVFPEKCAISADVDFERVGTLFEFSGGNIRNAAVRAAFMAAAANEVVNQRHVLDAAEREAREMGVLTRSLTAREREDEEAAAAGAGANDGEPGEASATAPARPGSRLVPITHPRGRS
jgi:ATP-dependent 26S proteasome regulatory subunit